MPKKKSSQEKPSEINLSDAYKDIEKAEIIDIMQIRERWYSDSKQTRSNFELTYKMEHG